MIFDQALETGASEEQLSAMREYQDGSPIPYSVLEDAVNRTFDCFDEAGIVYLPLEPIEPMPGFPVPQYGFNAGQGLTEEEALTLGDQCADRESTWITVMYTQQPAYVEAQDAAFEETRAELVACLRDLGVDIDDDATRDEIEHEAVTLLITGVVPEPTCVPP